jgi:hypothetical protein
MPVRAGWVEEVLDSGTCRTAPPAKGRFRLSLGRREGSVRDIERKRNNFFRKNLKILLTTMVKTP